MTKNDKNLLKQMIEAGRFSYPMYELLIKQNEANAKSMIKKMGSKWACHPDNYVKRLEVPLGQITKGSRVLGHIKGF